MNNFSALINYLFGNIIYMISAVIPKSNKIWVFGSWGGKQFADNPKYLFNYVNQYHQDIKVVWLTHNKEVVEKVRCEGKTAFKSHSLLGIWYSCRAKIGVISHGMIDINRYACARMEIVQTWHGIPMKPVLLSDQKQETIRKREKLLSLSLFFPFLKKELSFDTNLVISSTSNFVTNIFKKIFGTNAPVEETGFPRLDGLFRPKPVNEIGIEIKKYQDRGVKVGIYMPTYRREGEFKIINLLLSKAQEIEKFLKESNQVLYLKIHPFDFLKLPKEFSLERIKLIKNEEIDGDIYSVLGLFNYLITDYSSVVFDFLILSRPVFFLTPDRKEYIESNGDFVFDYESLNLPNFTQWEELFQALNNSYSELSGDLNLISNQFHKYKDDKSSKRLYHHIIKKISS